MKRLRNIIQHNLNPLHIYCRLCSLGLKGATARKVSTCYERLIYQRTSFGMIHPAK